MNIWQRIKDWLGGKRGEEERPAQPPLRERIYNPDNGAFENVENYSKPMQEKIRRAREHHITKGFER